MKQIPNYGDLRQLSWCVYCCGATETRDHVPSKVLLDRPFPANLPVVYACQDCNGSFSLHEEYLACLIACTLAGSTNPDLLERKNVRDILRRRPALRGRLSTARRQNDDGVMFMPEIERITNVILKLARGHAAFELNEPRFEEPASIAAIPLHCLTPEQRNAFETFPVSHSWPEVGSRAMQRLLIGYDMDTSGWITVQEGRYRFLVSIGDVVIIRIVLSEYLAGEVTWSV